MKSETFECCEECLSDHIRWELDGVYKCYACGHIGWDTIRMNEEGDYVDDELPEGRTARKGSKEST